jgi:hypothetical protein
VNNIKGLTGIEVLRRAVAMFNDCDETFNQQYTTEDLLKIAVCQLKSEYDYYPDQWTKKQLRDAIHLGKAPRWDDKEQPIE